MFLTTDIWDASVLRALGLPAITATGLATATIRDIEEVSRRFGWLVNGGNNQNDAAGPTEPPLRILVVGWRVSDMDTIEPDGLPDLAAMLDQFERHMQLDLQDVGIWLPIAADFEKAEFFLERRDFDSVREVFLDSAMDCCLSLAGFIAGTDESSELVSALQRVLDGREGDIGSHSPEAASNLARSAVYRGLVEPLLRRAQSTKDPYKRSLTAMAADISRVFFHRMMDELSSNPHDSAEDEASVRERLKLSQQFLAIVKEMRTKSK